MSSSDTDRGKKLQQQISSSSSRIIQPSRIPGLQGYNRTNSSSKAPRDLKPSPAFYTSRREPSSFGGEVTSQNKISYNAAPQSKGTVRPSGLPKPSATPSGSRDPTPVQNDAPKLKESRTKTNLAATFSRFGKSQQSEGRPRNVLRRKAPSIEQYAQQSRARLNTLYANISDYDNSLTALPSTDQVSKTHPDPDPDPSHTPTESQKQPFGRRTPKSLANTGTAEKSDWKDDMNSRSTPKELAGLSTAVNTNIPQPMPIFASASSPSTGYSDSPGPWSSRTSTPTSLSSYSPGIITPAKHASRLKPPSPTIFRSATPRQNSVPIPRFSNVVEKPSLPSKARTHPQPSSSVRVAEGRPMLFNKKEENVMLPQEPPPRKSSTKFKASEKQGTEIRSDGKAGKNKSHYTRTHGSEIPRPKQLPTSALVIPPPRPSREGVSGPEVHVKPLTDIKADSPNLQNQDYQFQYPDKHQSPKNLLNPSTESFQSQESPSISQSFAPSTSPYLEGKTRSLSESANRRRASLAKQSTGYKTSTETVSGIPLGVPRRSPKVPNVTPEPEQLVKQTRRGPAAGTGHEGYGRYAQRGRKPSIGGSTPRARSSSTSNSNSKGSSSSRGKPEIDDFLLNRLEPVVINGGGMEMSKHGRTESEQSTSTASVASNINTDPNRIETSYSGHDYFEPFGISNERFVQTPESLTSMRDDTINTESHQLAFAKGPPIRKPYMIDEQESEIVLPYSNTDFEGSRPSVESTTTTNHTYMSDSSTSDLTRINNSSNAKEVKAKKPEKRSRWNFFQRSRQNPPKQSVTEQNPNHIPEVPVSVSKVAISKPVAHYAILDNEPAESDSLEDTLQEAVNSPTDDESHAGEQRSPIKSSMKKRHAQSILLPPPPTPLVEYPAERHPSPKVFFNNDKSPRNPESNTGGRHASRLASVGRIPKVVSSKDSQQKFNPQSFSRPFGRFEPSLSPFAPPQRPLFSDQAPSQNLHTMPEINSDYTRPVQYNSPGSEFLAFSPERGSQISGSNSSDGRRMSLAHVTAAVPDPDSQHTEDEVWNEYDDLIDNILSPVATANHRPNPLNKPLQNATDTTKALQMELSKENQNPHSNTTYQSSRLSVVPKRSSADSVRLRRSVIQSALHSSTVSSTESYANDNGEFNDDTPPRIQTSFQKGKQDFGIDEKSRLDSNFDQSRHEFVSPQNQSNQSALQTNLRSGSLMTSRWLTFGRVLFSPAHNHVQSTDQGRILVIDGLGNDDWSFYCALTYPTAMVYSLSSSTPSLASTNPDAWQPLSNHKTVYSANTESAFPFSKDFFNVVIIRYPAVASERGLSNIISECKRVLRAGGYIETNIVDLDMVNMGNRTRKAVRMLKERMYMTDQSVNLKPFSDHIQMLLGQKGFENLNRCMVGVPVTGNALKSSDTSSSNQSSFKMGAATSSEEHRRKHSRVLSDDMNVSLGDLLTDSSSASNDESIAKMVSKVARWWYTRSYEAWMLEGENSDHSILSDRRVLRECQRRGTTFKMLIAYAQKPSEMPRRTASV